MKLLNNYIFEAKASEKARNKKPSGIFKTNKELRKVMNTYIGGDIYDLKGGNYEQEDTYVDTSSNGFIMDKEGNMYTVYASTSQGDAGRIVGGTTNYYVSIKKSDKDYISFRGWSAIFSKPHGDDIIYDITNGYYLEDYLAKHKYDIDRNELSNYEELIANGNKDAQSYEGAKREAKKLKEQEFTERYLELDNQVNFSVKEGEISIRKYGKISKITDDNILNELTEYAKNAISSTFNGVSLNDLDSLEFKIEFNNVTKETWKDDYVRVCFDTKTKSLVYLEKIVKHKKNGLILSEKRNILKTPVTYSLGNEFYIYSTQISPNFKKWFEVASKEWQKSKRPEKESWIEKKANEIYGDYMYSWDKKRISMTRAKQMAKEEWDNYMDSKIDANNKGKHINFDLEFISLGNAKIKSKPVKLKDKAPDTTPNELPEIEDVLDNKPKEDGSQPSTTELPKGSEAAIEKMKAWHDGKRGFNVKAASPAKLKLNYKVCKYLGYENEMKQIEAVAKEKGVVLESMFSLNEFVELKNRIDD